MKFDIEDNKFFDQLLGEIPYSGKFYHFNIEFIKKSEVFELKVPNKPLNEISKNLLQEFNDRLNSIVYREVLIDNSKIQSMYELINENDYRVSQLYAHLVFPTGNKGIIAKQGNIEIFGNRLKWNNVSDSNWEIEYNNPNIEEFLFNCQYLSQKK